MFLAMILAILIVPVQAYETSEIHNTCMEQMTSKESIVSTDGEIYTFNDEIILSKEIQVKPNKNWGLWLIIYASNSTSYNGCTITIYEKDGLFSWKYITSRHINAGEKIREKVINSCSGKQYKIEINADDNGISKLAGGIAQTEYV